MRDANDPSQPWVAMCLWRRPDSGIEAMHKLAAEAPRVIVWHNGDFLLGDIPENVRVVHTPWNAGLMARFHAALMCRSDKVIIWDDDMIPHPGWYDAWRSCTSHGAHEAVGQHGMYYARTPASNPWRYQILYGHRLRCDYVGLGGLIVSRGAIREAAPFSFVRELDESHADDIMLSILLGHMGVPMYCCPHLKQHFTWKNAHDEHSVYGRFKEERQRVWQEHFPFETWQYAGSRIGQRAT